MGSEEEEDSSSRESLSKRGVKVRNPHLESMDSDFLYHIGVGTGSHNLKHMFGDVKFVCVGGTPHRMKQFANYVLDELKVKLPAGTQLSDISFNSHRYAMFKIGPVLSVSHGMGQPSIGILLHELIKLMHHAQARDPIFFRLGTCGGIGIEGGDLIVTTQAVDGELNPYYELTVLGKKVRRPTDLDPDIAKELMSMRTPDDIFQIHTGKTMCTDDFYEGQGRLDGAFCRYTEDDKMAFLGQISQQGVKNMEMESVCFAAHCKYAKIRAAVVCVALLNRLNGDQITTPKEIMGEWQRRPQKIVVRFIKKQLKREASSG